MVPMIYNAINAHLANGKSVFVSQYCKRCPNGTYAQFSIWVRRGLLNHSLLNYNANLIYYEDRVVLGVSNKPDATFWYHDPGFLEELESFVLAVPRSGKA